MTTNANQASQPQAIRDGSALRAWTASMYTSPVNHAAAPLTVGAFGSMFMSGVSFAYGLTGLVRGQLFLNTCRATVMADMALGHPA